MTNGQARGLPQPKCENPDDKRGSKAPSARQSPFCTLPLKNKDIENQLCGIHQAQAIRLALHV